MSSYPFAPGLFADCLFDTNLLPATIVGPSGTANKLVSGSINGLQWIYVDPNPDENDLINTINNFISSQCYGVTSGYVCAGANASVKPCRYVVMNTNAQNPSQGAQELQVDENGDTTYISTNWTDEEPEEM